ncbi:hypothetical protein EDC18_106165 [Natranaerovirga pectinivora]|uniref:Uncharacterized protein n=2 Tax=Natranaerovirga pectinivora TaxID=682400 RepID=A0A4R3MKL5_9FIRM|nr:hypothetical protein EDC18_106165 [Natranaerovirga pectinivora]
MMKWGWTMLELNVMKKENIIEFIYDYVQKENQNNNNIIYEAFQGENQIILDVDAKFNTSKLIDNNSITIIGKYRNDENVIAKTSIFITEYDLYKDIFYWNYNKNSKKLSKKYLSDYREIIGEYAVIVGYIQIANKVTSNDLVSKNEIISFFYNFNKYLMVDHNLFVYVEPRGMYFLSKEEIELNSIIWKDNLPEELLREVTT